MLQDVPYVELDTLIAMFNDSYRTDIEAYFPFLRYTTTVALKITVEGGFCQRNSVHF